MNGIDAKQLKTDTHIYKIGKIPRKLWPLGDLLEPKFGKLGKEYSRIVFDKKYLLDDATLEWVTPGHPLFEVVRENVVENTQNDLQKGAVFYDINRTTPARLDVYTASILDGRSNVLHQKLFVVETEMDSAISIRQPTIFLDIVPTKNDVAIPDDSSLPDKQQVEFNLIEKALNPLLNHVTLERSKEIEIIRNHLEISLQELIHREQLHFVELYNRKNSGDSSAGLTQSIIQKNGWKFSIQG